MESPSANYSPASQEYIDPAGARSSIAREMDREEGATTPGQDDAPFIRFALDQLTRDEEVRGSRRYPGNPSFPVTGGVVVAGAEPFQSRQQHAVPRPASPPRDFQQQDAGASSSHGNMGKAAAVGAGVLALGAATAAGVGYSRRNREAEQQHPPPTQQWPEPSRPYDELPPRHPRHIYIGNDDRAQEANLYIPVEDGEGYNDRLSFLPGILRPLRLIFFIILLLVLLALLLTCAIWSLTHNGIFDYGSFGDGTYFIFEYLPTMLGMLLLVWIVQIQVALYRIAPFIAMSAPASPRSWEEGAKLPLYPKTWFLPFGDHCRVPGFAVIGFFMVVSWLQIFTIPLLASAFNVYFFGGPENGSWRWVATAALIWIVIALYILQLIAAITLLFWLRKKRTGLKWDPRSLADMIVLLERSNALSMTDDDEIRHEPPRLGQWRTSRNTNEVFHTYGLAQKPARMYSVRNGRLTEKQPLPANDPVEPKSRFSDFQDVEMGREQRHSREKMLPRHPSSDRSSSHSSGAKSGGNALPWFLRPSFALLWIILAIVLLIAFLVVSYLPSTRVSAGFTPMVSAPVNNMGYSTTNFLYSFLPAILATIGYLGLLDIDYAYRRLQPYTSLLTSNGEIAERSLLLSYPADLPILVTLRAALNTHLRVAALSFTSLLSLAIPVFAGGCFWAQFDTELQTIKIYAHMPAFYALTFFVAVYGLAIATCVWPGKARAINEQLPRGNEGMRWCDVVDMFRGSRLLDDVQFRGPATKIDLVTRLLSSSAGAGAGTLGRSQGEQVATSKVSLAADSIRGFGNARQVAAPAPARAVVGGEVARYGLGAYTGRDGREGWGVDRVRV